VSALPRRDAGARAFLDEHGRRARPTVLARDRALTVPGSLGDQLPGGAVWRGAVVTVEGTVGSGATSAAMAIVAAATAVGEWAAVVDSSGTWGALAAADAGVALDRCAVVRPSTRFSLDQWAAVVAALLDGTSVVVAEVPRHARAADARRLVARARERRTVLVSLCAPRITWPADAALRIRADGGVWHGLGAGHGLLAGCTWAVTVHGAAVAGASPVRAPVLAEAG